jgi:hypothetical protein
MKSCDSTPMKDIPLEDDPTNREGQGPFPIAAVFNIFYTLQSWVPDPLHAQATREDSPEN